MKKLVTGIVTAALLFISVHASAVHHSVSNSYIYQGMEVYSVSLYNNHPYAITYRLTATNGANYTVRIVEKSWSKRMRINDLTAQFKWSCSSST
jgi:hypothetical protein